MIKTAIVILNWNGKHHLEQFLPSVTKHSNLPETKIIIADNGSIDDSLSFVKEHYPNIDILELPQNYGFAEGYNRALAQINAEYYVILNSDVEVTDNWLSPIITRMDQDKNIGACQPKILSYLKKNEFEYAGASGGFIDHLGYPFCRGRVLNVLDKDKGQHDTEIDIFWATGAALFVRAEVFHNCGRFDGDFFAHMEEIDLCWRIKNHGYSIKCIPQSSVYHLGGGTLPNNNPRKVYLNFRNNLFLLFKNLPKQKLIKVLLLRMILDGIAAFKFLLGFNIKSFFAIPKAHLHFYSNLKSLKIKRKQYNINVDSHPEMLQKSLILQFFIKGNNTYEKLMK